MNEVSLITQNGESSNVFLLKRDERGIEFSHLNITSRVFLGKRQK